MLWGQNIKVFTDHTHLIRDALGMTSDCVYQWRLLLNEYGPEIVYIKGIHNTVANTISWLEYDPSVNQTAESYYDESQELKRSQRQNWINIPSHFHRDSRSTV
jgi:hypothetical protein